MLLYSMLRTLGRAVSFQAWCQWALLSVHITRHYDLISEDSKRNEMILRPCSGQKHINILYFSVKTHAGSFRVSVIHPTLTKTTGSVKCVRDHSSACIFTRGSIHFQETSASHALTQGTQSRRNILKGLETSYGMGDVRVLLQINAIWLRVRHSALQICRINKTKGI